MSHVVTITRVKKRPSISCSFKDTTNVILKASELLISIACVGIVTTHMEMQIFNLKAELYFLIVAVTCLVGTFCLLMSYAVCLSALSEIPKTAYEVTYHGIGCILYLTSGIIFLLEMSRLKNIYEDNFTSLFAAAIMGLLNAILYLLSALLSYSQFRSIDVEEVPTS